MLILHEYAVYKTETGLIYSSEYSFTLVSKKKKETFFLSACKKNTHFSLEINIFFFYILVTAREI
jgi:hypothetical protein